MSYCDMRAKFTHPTVVGCFYKVGDVFYYDRSWHGGKRLRISTKQTDLDLAAQWVRDRPFGSRVVKKPLELTKAFSSRLVHQAKCGAKARGIPFGLTMAHFDAMWERSGGYCEVSGIPFALEAVESSKRRPYAPSIDRRDGVMGYYPDNCRLVCAAVNLAMNEFGESVLWDIACSMALKRTKKAL
jgi:hypothetical protein